jgi:hypothetical protein
MYESARPGVLRDMRWRRFRSWPHCVVLAVLLASCRSRPPGEQSTTGPPLLEPVVPANYQKIPPGPVDDPRQILGQTATIFRGSLKSVQFTYDGCAGPRTNYVFSDSVSLAGTQVQSEVTLKVLGGPTPGGRWVRVSEIPRLALDSQYVTFLRNTDWTFSPIVGNLVFRVETVAGREVLVHPSGHAVTGWGEDGPVLSAAAVSEAIGSQLRGYRSADAPYSAGRPSSAEAEPNGELKQSAGALPTAEHLHDSLIARAPSPAEARKAGLFARPAMLVSVLTNLPTVSIDTFVAAARTAADRAQVTIGGRLSLDPNWRCWSSTPTARVAQ